MARYDRIARIAPPDRDDCFPGWLTLRDLDGREREPDLGRRARLRFLALRPVRRLIRRGLDGPTEDSLRLQVEGVRHEIERLNARDPERSRLIEYLAEVGGRSALGLANATLDVGAAAEGAGHPYAAEEFYRTGVDLARAHGLVSHEVRALRRLARVHRVRGEHDAAVTLAREAADCAMQAGETVQWALAMEEVARAEDAAGRRSEGTAVLDRMTEQGEAWDDDQVRAITAATRCAFGLAAGEFETTLRAGLTAIELFAATDPHRNGAMLDMASAFRRVGLWDAAEICYRVVETHSTWVEHRAEATTERAVLAAERGDSDGFRRLRERILETIDAGDLRLCALLHLGLGRGCLVVDDDDDARAHLRQAIACARDADLDSILGRADELLGLLERGDRLVLPRPRLASPESRAVAEAVRHRLENGVPAGG